MRATARCGGRSGGPTARWSLFGGAGSTSTSSTARYRMRSSRCWRCCARRRGKPWWPARARKRSGAAHLTQPSPVRRNSPAHAVVGDIAHPELSADFLDDGRDAGVVEVAELGKEVVLDLVV